MSNSPNLNRITQEFAQHDPARPIQKIVWSPSSGNYLIAEFRHYYIFLFLRLLKNQASETSIKFSVNHSAILKIESHKKGQAPHSTLLAITAASFRT